MPIDPTTQLFYESSDPSNAPTIIFLHGGGLGGWMWRYQVRAFEKQYHCLVPDLPEHGGFVHLCSLSQFRNNLQ